MAARERSPEGHKLRGYSYGVACRCECGWASSTWYGKGAKGQALCEWRIHQDAHRRALKEG